MSLRLCAWNIQTMSGICFFLLSLPVTLTTVQRKECTSDNPHLSTDQHQKTWRHAWVHVNTQHALPLFGSKETKVRYLNPNKLINAGSGKRTSPNTSTSISLLLSDASSPGPGFCLLLKHNRSGRTWLRTATSYQWSTDSTRLRRWLCTIFLYYSISRFFFADYATLLLVCKCNYYRMKHKWFIGKCRFDQKLLTARRTHPGEKWSEPEMRSRDCRCWQH